ncbi:hypothetical protein B0T24DRAFT_601136 [Lasiosphaeria ovina]|uniref:Uncharacterized protein n=1 Tax=Lasiosphaeria ovina TaxID=92902 RepID=A0AAE0NIX4_9PEZI|nr:hypothetical protein B0T24DRAFT_601136 [Lasiosphaeria ovina]
MSSLADAHIALANNEQALTLLAQLANTTSNTIEERRTRLRRRSALARTATARERTGEYALALATWEQMLDELRSTTATNIKQGDGIVAGRMDELSVTRRIASVRLRMGDVREALEWGERAVMGFRQLGQGKMPAVDMKREGEEEEEEEEEEGNEAEAEKLKTLEFLAQVKILLGRWDEAI